MKITVDIEPSATAENKRHLRRGSEAVQKTLGNLGDLSCYVEVVIISIASWAQNYNDLYVRMIMNYEGKKKEEPLFIPRAAFSFGHYQQWVDDWLKPTLTVYLSAHRDANKKKLGILERHLGLPELKKEGV